ncbi:hypothetical protein CRG98_001047 [Punica granatum]|uniref:Uncharacterized protein n=1 Tax=Punica granatum TaxID=22663 RepID=A0A2I0LD12_PUNGR|nr:hypothetical protein CRG98_001047 [Punica granatum]
MARHVMTRGRSSRPPTPHDRRVLHLSMARRAMTRGRPSRPPTSHNRRVVPTFVDRSPVVFTSPRQDELWPEGRSTFSGSDPASAPAPHLLHRALAPLLGFGHSSGFCSTFGLRPRIYCIRPRSCIYCFRPLAQHLLLLGSGPAFTAFRF